MNAAINDKYIAKASVIGVLSRIVDAISIMEENEVILKKARLRNSLDKKVNWIGDDFTKSTKQIVARCFGRHIRSFN